MTYDNIQYGLFEAALMADGIAPRDLYPLDIDRAFRVLDRIRDDLILARDLEACDDLVASGDAIMALYSQNHAYLARHRFTTTAIMWRQQILLCEYLTIPRGAPHRAEAEALIDYIVSPEPQSRLSRDLTYSPINIDAVPDATMAPHMTFTHRSPDDAAFDDEWWADHDRGGPCAAGCLEGIPRVRVASVRTILVTCPWKGDPFWVEGQEFWRTAALIEVTADEGITGLGETIMGYFAAGDRAAARRLLRPAADRPERFASTPPSPSAASTSSTSAACGGAASGSP